MNPHSKKTRLKKNISLAIGIAAGLYLVSSLLGFSSSERKGEAAKQQRKKPFVSEYEDYSLWI